MTSKEIITMIAVSLGSFMVTLDISIVNVALPAIQNDLNSSIINLQWIVDAYALSLSALILSSGVMSDRFGKKRIWIIGISVFTLGSLLCTLAVNNIWLIIGRITQGIGGAALIPGAMSIIMMTFSDHHIRNKMVGIWSSITAIALIAGPILGGFLVDYFGWWTIFSINLPIGLFVIGLSIYAVQSEPQNYSISLDPIGQVLTIIMLGTLTFGLIELSQAPSLLFIIMIFSMTAFSLILFILWERQISAPLIPLSLFKSWQFCRNNLASFVIGFATYSNIFFLSLYFQNAQGYSAVKTGIHLAPEFIAMGIFAMSYGKLAKIFDTEHLIRFAFVLIFISSMIMAFFTHNTNYRIIAITMFVMGSGMGIAIPAISLLTLKDAKSSNLGSISAIMNAFRQTGMAISIALLGAIMSFSAEQQLKTLLSAMTNYENVANNIITQAIISHDLNIPLTQIQASWAYGFNMAMVGAAISTAIVIICLLIKRDKT